MKKTYLTLASIILCVGYGILSWDIVTHSVAAAPEDSQFAGLCSNTVTTPSSLPITMYNECCIDYNEALDAVKRDWQNSLQQLINQEKPASEMVDDGYESLRTYDCWAEYICRAVQYSGHAPIESAQGTGLKKTHLGVVPGCQSPDNLRMGSEYNKFLNGLKEVPIMGVPAGAIGDLTIDTFNDIKTENQINFFPRCMTDPIDNERPNLTQAKEQYDACKRALELNFGCPAGVDDALCADTSTAFVTLETVLKKRQGDQKAAALEKKLSTIVPKLQNMEAHVDSLKNFLKQLDDRFVCYAGKCT
jgi:hypothetical protein